MTLLAISTLSLYNLCWHKGALPHLPGAFFTHQAWFLAEDIAWFAAGCSSDGQHEHAKDHFHIMDHIFGGSTMVIHVNGTNTPGSPSLPEFIKAHVYLPPTTVIKEILTAHATLASMVQAYIEQVGTATTSWWTQTAKTHLKFLLMQNSSGNPSLLPQSTQLIPILSPAHSVHYIFNGHCYRTLPLTLLQSSTPSGDGHGNRPTCSPAPNALDGGEDQVIDVIATIKKYMEVEEQL
ncbi:hypothetical protein CVT25_013687 [Psilocybe cyanescens]|uniref:Uncharacterized protein n=1 Tax=Psilocybe cyanescens TaxID=93625 RepID=A0A409XB93_PSICY|nr:hypothetical protein CVT25_013687 [Psilocybe cyanescens]